ncbi:FirrV-1-B11 [Feldmannia irregularis virus a]|uniref:FirrV-1-B11 n=1 Tax=Feldmannia irregularis virus a TaxID=231992 RepID=Q6XM25_9PHYC|nr:FirrV-1-B11 [Feldmannia irregularis virus a]AAR26886.1 FirrV-1-B11 [Feldmannia irregularis virus a]
MRDAEILHRAMNNRRVSGPWRATMWRTRDGHVTWVFSEEHENKGACGLEVQQTDLTSLVAEIIRDTKNVHVFLEHFVHAADVQRTCTTSNSTLQNLRGCLPKGPRIHYIDPRTDLVAILPNGQILEAIVHYAHHLHSQHKDLELKLLLYETFIHPLLSIVSPSGDSAVLEGRLNTVLQKYVANMTTAQMGFFRDKWSVDVIANIENVRRIYHECTTRLSNLPALLEAYTDTVNRFMDLWLLANFFVAENSGMTGSIIYAGSKHSLHFEKYLAEMRYELLEQFTNRDLSACLALRY